MTNSSARRINRRGVRLPICVALSPTSAKLKKQTEAMHRKSTIGKAAQDVKRLKLGVTNTYGLIPSVVKKYQSIGYDFVTRGTICHYLDQEKKKRKEKPVLWCDDDVPTSIDLGTSTSIDLGTSTPSNDDSSLTSNSI